MLRQGKNRNGVVVKRFLPKNIHKRMINFDYGSLVQKTENGYRLKYDNKLLLSVSRLTRLNNEYKMFSIPAKILDERREIGTQFMKNLQFIIDEKMFDISACGFFERDIIYISKFIHWLFENRYIVRAVEKLYTNGNMIAFFDVIIEWEQMYWILEIKIRNEHVVRKSDEIQCKAYACLFQLPVKLVMIDDNGNITTKDFFPSKKYFKTMIEYYKEWFDIDLDFYSRIDIG